MLSHVGPRSQTLLLGVWQAAWLPQPSSRPHPFPSCFWEEALKSLCLQEDFAAEAGLSRTQIRGQASLFQAGVGEGC